jgi:hypothetical protein
MGVAVQCTSSDTQQWWKLVVSTIMWQFCGAIIEALNEHSTKLLRSRRVYRNRPLALTSPHPSSDICV